MAAIFAQPDFPSKYERMLGNCTRIVAAEMVRIDSPPISPTSYVLDNACGPGIVTEQVKLLQPQTKILAGDVSPAMVEDVKQKIESKGWKNVETEELDMRNLSKLADNTFTHVLTNFGTFVPNEPGSTLLAIKEMYRVLQIGGVAVTTLWAGNFLMSLLVSMTDKVDRAWLTAFYETARLVRPLEEPREAMKIEPEMLKGSWLLKQLEDGGFGNNVEVRSCLTSTSAASLDELVENVMLSAPFFFGGYSEQELFQAKPILKQKLQEVRTFQELEGGAVKIGMKAWIGVGRKKGDEMEVAL